MKISFASDENGPLKVFRQPEPDMVYTMGVDASTGLADDYSVIQVVANTIPFYQCAVFRAKWPVNQVSQVTDRIGRWYNDALAVVESNYPGNSVQDALIQIYQYPRNYQREDVLDEDPGISHKYGFRMTETTKWMLIHELQGFLANKEVVINDKETLFELSNYVYLQGKNKAGASPGFNDDTVVALMLALHGAKLFPVRRELKTEGIIGQIKDPDVRGDWRRFKERLMNRMNEPEEQGIIL